MREFILVLVLCLVGGQVAAQEVREPTVQEIEELILTEVYPILTGDDGIECEAEIVSLQILSREENQIPIRVVARRDETRHGCGPETIRCDVKLTRDHGKGWITSFKCE